LNEKMQVQQVAFPFTGPRLNKQTGRTEIFHTGDIAGRAQC
jgi:hypothetical protein